MYHDPYWQYENKTKTEIEAYLKKYGCKGNLEENQNDSPSVQEFLDMAKTWPTITYNGYVVEKPREDFRVSIEGFDITGITADQALALLDEFGYADEHTYSKEKNGTYSVHTWWD
ncbi:MAG: hypothetical protein KGJ07_09755 [Patescibacteria group bacterium]|nr:hypothetical protein [Patescibacteria group bacterium]